jgi:hypothetical protein
LYNKYIKENYMTTNIRTGAVTGSGAVLDTLSSVTVADTRIRSIYYSGVGTFLITGSQTDENGSTSGSNIKFVGTTNVDAGDIYVPDNGVRMIGPVKVSAPTSASTVTVFYG